MTSDANKEGEAKVAAKPAPKHEMNSRRDVRITELPGFTVSTKVEVSQNDQNKGAFKVGDLERSFSIDARLTKNKRQKLEETLSLRRFRIHKILLPPFERQQGFHRRKLI
ncbi:MAG: hypothetical protein IIY32_03370, partial [Thermoguttaceae bacterium]|nr:hypothetical protein [Thermoguttaceae bacterium]